MDESKNAEIVDQNVFKIYKNEYHSVEFSFL